LLQPNIVIYLFYRRVSGRWKEPSKSDALAFSASIAIVLCKM
jgi:hypothetical protein